MRYIAIIKDWRDCMNRIVKREDLEDGMVLYADVITSFGTLLVNRGTMIDSRVRELLSYNKINEVKIVETGDPEDEFGELDTHLNRLRSSAKFKEISQEYGIVYDKVSNHFNDVLNRENKVNKEKIVDNINSILQKTEGSKDLFDMLNGLRMKEDRMYMHSLNTALISNILARWLKMTEEEISDVTIAGLFHDIGLMSIPSDILEKKPEERTMEENDLLQKHTIFGYRYLMKRELNRQIGLTALTHHERMDGTGYPLQCMGGALCTFSRIVAIADAYDELTLMDNGGRNPFDLIRVFEQEGLAKYDPHFIMVFLAGITDTYIGCDILLDNGEIGTIIYINRDNLSRPMVKVGEKYINLATETSLKIRQFV